VAVRDDDGGTSDRVVRQLDERIRKLGRQLGRRLGRQLGRQLGRKTMEVEILEAAWEKARPGQPMWLAQSQSQSQAQAQSQSQPKDGSR